jgi:hypothetical protein
VINETSGCALRSNQLADWQRDADAWPALRTGSVRLLLCSLIISWQAGCSSREAEPSFSKPSASSAALVSADAAPSAPAPAAPNSDAANSDAGSDDAGSIDADGWRHFARQDDVPVCLFTTWRDWEQTPFISQVKPATLRTDHAINFGVFAPGCAAPECERDQTMQCWADVEGSQITLHTRYSGWEKPGATCTTGCATVNAQCNTPLMPKGDYTIVYAGKTWKVRVPSVIKPGCLKR